MRKTEHDNRHNQRLYRTISKIYEHFSFNTRTTDDRNVEDVNL